jgi:hypothetical protein
MSFVDATTGEYSDASFGLDSQAALNNESSIFDTVSGVITKAIPLTALAVVNSFANTGIDLANWAMGTSATGDGFQRWEPDKQMQAIGADDYADYYKAHQEGIEGAGFLVGSLIPGLSGVKAFKMLQLGRPGAMLTRATNLFAGVKADAVAKAVSDINAGDDALFGLLSSQKFKAIAAGYGDQALQALAFETAVAGTMNSSPIMKQQDMGDIATNMFYGVLMGGAIGGSLDAFFVKGAIKRAQIAADVATKEAELTTQYGFASGVSYHGQSIAGDRAALLLSSIDEAYGPPTSAAATAANLVEKKASDRALRADTTVKLLLGELAGKGNEDLSFSLADTLKDLKQQGMTKDDLMEKLGGLAKISRVDEAPSVPTGDSFYVNRFLAKDVNPSSLTFDDLVTNYPHPAADLSLRYSIRPNSTPVIANYADTLSVPLSEGKFTSVPTYGTVTEAFENGVDIFIGKGLKPSVNPQAPNLQRVARPGESRALTIGEERGRTKAVFSSGLTTPETMGPLTTEVGALRLPEGSAPLTGAPLVLNTVTKAISSDAVPVVGDYGAVKLVRQGLSYGNKLSLQSVEDGASVLEGTSSTEANARYVWAASRGIKAGDSIATDDIPMLEEMYRSSQTSGATDFSAYMDGLRRRGVTFSDDSDLPYSPRELLDRIERSKDDLIENLISNNPKMSSEEVALRANVPESYLESGFRANKPEDFMVDPTQYQSVNHIKLEYDIGNTNTRDGQILRGLLDSQQRIQVITDALDTVMAREFGNNWQNFKVNGLSSKDATITGAGAKFLTYANADYGTLEQQLERIGRYVGQEVLSRRSSYSEMLAPHANAMRLDPVMATEVAAFVAVRRRTGESFSFLPSDVAARYWRSGDTAVLTRSLVRDSTGAIVDWDKDLTPNCFLPGAAKAVEVGVSAVPPTGLHTFYDLSPKVAAFERAQMEINNNILQSRNNWWAAMGIARNQGLDTLYAPAIDTVKNPYFALVRAKPGMAFSDDSLAMITATNQQELEQKAAALRSDFDVIDRSQAKDFRVALGDYQNDRNFMSNRTQADLNRRGILNDVFPETNAEDMIQQYVAHNNRMTSRLVRDYVEMGNAQLFAEIDAMGAKFAGAATSKFGFLGKYFASSEENPYASYKKTALDIGPREEYKLWADSQEKLEAFASSAYNTAATAISGVAKGILPLEDTVAIMENMGLGNPYAKATNTLTAYQDIANKLPDTRVLSRLVAAGNLFQSATTVRLDFFQSLINLISTPILTMAETSSIAKRLSNPELTTILPDGSNGGAGRTVLSTTKPIFGAIADLFNPAVRAEIEPFLERSNITRSTTNEYFQAINNLAIPKSGTRVESIMEGINSAMEVGASITGSQWSENMARMLSALTARRIFMAEGLAPGSQQLEDNMITFVNRVHGNYVASQRPVAFQGPVGQAIGLFQTYQFNFFQQLLRYVDNGEGKTLATLGALQTSLFGLQGLPGFQMINQHIVGTAAGNPSHQDLYSGITNYFSGGYGGSDKRVGDYLLYGVASNWLNAGLYSRGDINPRSLTVLPINPLEYPAISGGVRFISNLLDTADKVIQGGNLSSSLLQGLEHNGLSRPLSGLGQLMQGFVSTSTGSLITAIRPNMGNPANGDGNVSGWSDLVSVANFSRLAGARPLDEAIAMDMTYRSTLYQAKDTSRMERLGAAVKEDLAGGQPIDTAKLDTFIHSYANAGGEIAHFGQAIMKWSQEANVAKANEVFRHLSDPMARTQMEQMGGRPLPDFVNRGAINTTPPLPTATSLPGITSGNTGATSVDGTTNSTRSGYGG